jgi:predicted DNA-binding WGR domain protein
MSATLIRVDPEKRMNRRYSVIVQPTLLDPVAVVCVWGSRRSNYQRVQVHPAATPEEAQETAEKIVRVKIRRGYRLTGESSAG